MQVIICGAGVAGIEALLRLRALAGSSVDITLLSPDEYLDYRPLSVVEPFDDQSRRQYPIAGIAADAQAHWLPESLDWVDRHNRLVHTRGGKSLPYDALLLAVGGRRRHAAPHLTVFPETRGAHGYRRILQGIDSGDVSELAFVMPEGPSWPLPLYELALMTGHYAGDRQRAIALTFITPEKSPLGVFGAGVSAEIAALLAARDIAVYCSSNVEMPAAQRLFRMPSGSESHPQYTLTLPSLTGPDVHGIPGDAVHRFLPVDEHCRVLDTDGHIFAAGDATGWRIKHGALSVQQAHTAAAGIARLAGLDGPCPPLHPVLQGTLWTGSAPLYLSAHFIAGQGWNGQLHGEPPWDPQDKVVGADLGPYLRRRFDVGAASTTRPHSTLS